MVDRPALVVTREWYRPRASRNESGHDVLLLEERWQDALATWVSCLYCAAPWVFVVMLGLWTFGGPAGLLVVKVLAGAGLVSLVFGLGRFG